ncbi:MAG: pyridoxine 5'-phosphate synthase [Pseudomonadales bacterium]|nr:pyridoxine 5'-phosphate synthase [Pseudomonadales bacterium]
MIKLSVNINKIALLRNSRPGNNPDLIAYARHCIEAGAQGITVHPRPDQRHIRASDIEPLSHLIQSFENREFNMEGNPFSEAQGSYPGFIELVTKYKPDQCTLVPDSLHQLTSDHGFNLKSEGDLLQPLIRRLKDEGIRVSLFMDAQPDQIEIAAAIGADRIELYTGPFAHAFDSQDKNEMDRIYAEHCKSALRAHQLGMAVNAGHDLNRQNLQMYARLPHLQEVSIGHALTIDSIYEGLEKTVQGYLACLQ